MSLPRPKPTEHPHITPVPPVRPELEEDFSGQRRLIRPSLPTGAANGRQSALYGHRPALTARVEDDAPIDIIEQRILSIVKERMVK